MLYLNHKGWQGPDLMRHNKKTIDLRNGRPTGGYTVVETLIFLAVSALLAISALRLVGGQQAKTEFNQAVRDFDLRLQDAINDVATGYYYNTNSFTCVRSGSAPLLAAGAGQQGKNKDCIFLGQILGFGEDGGRAFSVYTLVGLRQNDDPEPKDITSLAESAPRTVNLPGTVLQESLLNGLSIRTVKYDNGVPVPVGAVGFITGFSTASGSLKTDTTNADVFPIIGTTFGGGGAQIESNVAAGTGLSVMNPNSGIYICMESTASNNAYAIITIGGYGNQLGTKLELKNGDITADPKCA